MNLEQYIRQAAAARGINPDIAIRVAMSEGGLNDPVRQSDFSRGGAREPSYGPFQLLIGGGGTGFPEGLGNQALNAGIDPRRPENAYRAIDFALDHARNNGWGAWYGAKAQGITGRAGIGGTPTGPLPTPPTEFTGPLPPDQIPVPASGFGQLSAPMQAGGVDPRRFGGMDMPLTPSPDPAGMPGTLSPGAMVASNSPSRMPFPAQPAAPSSSSRLADIAALFGDMGGPQQPQFSPVQIQGPSPQQATALTSFLAALKNKRLA